MLFNIYDSDFNDDIINQNINEYLPVYDYCYSII